MIMETKLKFKIGDKVRVKSLEWYNSNKNIDGNVRTDEDYVFLESMAKYCGCDLIIAECRGNVYKTEDNDFIWQDYMFEDEQEKQEIEQPHKKKTSVLTKEVAQAIVRCTKYRLENEIESTQLQEKLFEIGCEWNSGYKEVKKGYCKYLYVNKDLKIQMGDKEDDDFYMKEPSAELSVNDILNIEIKEKDMETKEMTKADVFANLGSTKILCTSTEESAKVQEKLFELGITWMSNGINVRKNRYLLSIGKQREIAYCSNIETLMQDINRRIEPAEILAIKLKEEEAKFDPKSLRPFDKVLVRDLEYEVWVARFFDYYENGFYYTTSSACSWKCCVPYCDETKHLHRTAEDAPDYYKNW